MVLYYKIITIIAMIIVGLVMIFFSFKTSYGHASFSNLVNHGGIFQMDQLDFNVIQMLSTHLLVLN